MAGGRRPWRAGVSDAVDGEREITTPFYIAAYVLGALSIVVGWLRGSHSERFGAAILLLDYVVSRVGDHWRVRDSELVAVTQDLALLLIFAWFARTADRWWPLVVTALLALVVMVRVIGIVNPELSRYALESAVLGCWILLYAVVLAGVAERWLAGESAASGLACWRRRKRTT